MINSVVSLYSDLTRSQEGDYCGYVIKCNPQGPSYTIQEVKESRRRAICSVVAGVLGALVISGLTVGMGMGAYLVLPIAIVSFVAVALLAKKVIDYRNTRLETGVRYAKEFFLGKNTRNGLDEKEIERRCIKDWDRSHKVEIGDGFRIAWKPGDSVPDATLFAGAKKAILALGATNQEALLLLAQCHQFGTVDTLVVREDLFRTHPNKRHSDIPLSMCLAGSRQEAKYTEYDKQNTYNTVTSIKKEGDSLVCTIKWFFHLYKEKEMDKLGEDIYQPSDNPAAIPQTYVGISKISTTPGDEGRIWFENTDGKIVDIYQETQEIPSDGEDA